MRFHVVETDSIAPSPSGKPCEYRYCVTFGTPGVPGRIGNHIYAHAHTLEEAEEQAAIYNTSPWAFALGFVNHCPTSTSPLC